MNNIHLSCCEIHQLYLSTCYLSVFYLKDLTMLKLIDILQWEAHQLETLKACWELLKFLPYCIPPSRTLSTLKYTWIAHLFPQFHKKLNCAGNGKTEENQTKQKQLTFFHSFIPFVWQLFYNSYKTTSGYTNMNTHTNERVSAGSGGGMGQGSETSNAQIIECAVRTKDPPHDDGCWVVKARWRGEGEPERDRGRRLSCMCRWRKDSSSNSGSCKLSWKLFPLANALRTNKFLLTICKFSSNSLSGRL